MASRAASLTLAPVAGGRGECMVAGLDLAAVVEPAAGTGQHAGGRRAGAGAAMG